jgi:hypothetical protein
MVHVDFNRGTGTASLIMEDERGRGLAITS